MPRPNHLVRAAANLLAVLAVMLGIGMSTAASASAATPATTRDVAVVAAVDCADITYANTAQCASADVSLLPVYRWREASTGFHSRLDAKLLSDLAAKVNRDATQTWLMTAGNAIWSMTAAITEWSSRLQIVQSIGKVIDTQAATIGSAIVKSPLVGGLIGLGLVLLLWRTYSGRGSFANGMKSIAKSLVILAVMVMMITGAAKSTGSGSTYEAGTFSPGWFATTINNSIAGAAGTIASSVAIDQNGVDPTNVARSGPYSCSAYTKALKKMYSDSAGSKVSEQQTAVPLVINNMWELTGLNTWVTAQLGDSTDAYTVYCRLLEQRAGVPGSNQIAVMKQACTLKGYTQCLEGAKPGALAWGAGNLDDGTNDAEDRGMVAWVVCAPSTPMGASWSVQHGWGQFKKGSKSADDITGECAQWWSKTDWSGGDNGNWFSDESALNVREFDSSVVEALPVADDGTVPQEQRTLLWRLHGNTSGGAGGTIATFIYVGASMVNFGVFAFVSVIIIAAKLAAIVFMLMAFFVLAVALWPGKADDAVVGRFVKSFVGTSFIAFGYSVILALLVLITSTLVSAVAGLSGGAGSIVTMMFSGIAPLVAVVMISKVFTGIFRMPNPMSLKGAMAYGAMGGAMGGAVGSTLGNRLSGAGRSLGKKATQAISDKATGSSKSAGTSAGRRRADAAAGGMGAVGGAAAAEALEAKGTPTLGGKRRKGQTREDYAAELAGAKGHAALDREAAKAVAVGAGDRAALDAKTTRATTRAEKALGGADGFANAAQHERIAALSGALGTKRTKLEALGDAVAARRARDKALGAAGFGAGHAIAQATSKALPKPVVRAGKALAPGMKEAGRTAAQLAGALKNGERGFAAEIAKDAGSRAALTAKRAAAASARATGRAAAHAVAHPGQAAKTALKTGGKVALGAGAVVVAAAGGAPLVAAGYAAYKGRQAVKERWSDTAVAERDHALVEKYREHQAQQTAARAEAEASKSRSQDRERPAPAPVPAPAAPSADRFDGPSALRGTSGPTTGATGGSAPNDRSNP